jgi:methylated-DNA-[protein]-cysteine S-methyltransferase
VGVQLPERHESRTAARVVRRSPSARESTPPPEITAAIEEIVALLDGDARDLSGIALDLEGVADFDRRVYEVARTIAPGETMSYGAIAARIDEPGAARGVGQALGRNPFAIVVPCHRVVAADGGLGGFSAVGGSATKRRMLAIEGAAVAPPTLFG